MPRLLVGNTIDADVRVTQCKVTLLQCGFCTPGMVMSAIELVEKNPNPSEQDVREGLEGNICRCTGYHNIVKSVQAGAQKMGV